MNHCTWGNLESNTWKSRKSRMIASVDLYGCNPVHDLGHDILQLLEHLNAFDDTLALSSDRRFWMLKSKRRAIQSVHQSSQDNLPVSRYPYLQVVRFFSKMLVVPQVAPPQRLRILRS